jgi:prepilin-type N-terminal cleavage/methylation domain-containing protein
VTVTRSDRGFTLLELLMSLAVFTMLGTMVIFLMRQGLDVFAVGTAESSAQDRAETILPRIVHDLEGLTIPANFDPPPPRLSEEERMMGREERPLPPVRVRLRSARFPLKDVPDGPLKALPALYAAWVVDVSEDRSDPWLRRAGGRTGKDLKPLTPDEVDQANVDTAFHASGGLREVCYIAVAEEPLHPALMTLYAGWRSPVGGPDSLLEPTNLNTLDKVHAHCRPISRGILHMETRWRRVFATSWDVTNGRVGPRDPYVGAIWDSTRALDKEFPLFVSPDSLADPSDDVFPAWVRLDLTIVPPDALGLGRGETSLSEGINTSADEISVADVAPFTGPGPEDRWLKVDGEWMAYDVGRVRVAQRTIPVRRGQRGTVAASHEGDADVYVGLTSRRTVRLLYRDLYAVDVGTR